MPKPSIMKCNELSHTFEYHPSINNKAFHCEYMPAIRYYMKKNADFPPKFLYGFRLFQQLSLESKTKVNYGGIMYYNSNILCLIRRFSYGKGQ